MFLIFRAYRSPKKFLAAVFSTAQRPFPLVPNFNPFRCSRAETFEVEKIPLNDSSALGSQVKDTCSIHADF